MQDLAQFSNVVEKIYDSALDAGCWADALAATCAFVQGCAANLFYQTIPDNKTTLFHSFGEDEHYRHSYIEKYWRLNPLFPASSFLRVGTVHRLSDIIPIDEFRESRLFKEWVEPQGVLDALYVNLERTATGAAAMAIRRRASDGLFDEAAKSRFQLVVPHVRRAVAIGKIVEQRASTESALSATLDKLDVAVVLVAADGRLVHVNGSAREMLSEEVPLHASGGRLAATDPQANDELQQALARAAHGDRDLGTKGIALALSATPTKSQIAHVLSLASGRRRGMLRDGAAAVVFVYDTALPRPGPLEVVAGLYALTAGELRVLAALTQESGVATIARSLGVADATVKSHLQQLFAKTGVRRQADLIKLLVRHASPVKA